MKIYTKTGDAGTTSLMGGRRISKADAQVEAYGQIDELNAWLGHLAADLASLDQDELREDVLLMQRALFKIGSLYSYDFTCGKEYGLPFITAEDVEFVEVLIDKLESGFPPLKNFILPGGSAEAARVQIARTVCRRTERSLLRFALPADSREREALCHSYLNRLSDFLFVLARYENFLSDTPEAEF